MTLQAHSSVTLVLSPSSSSTGSANSSRGAGRAGVLPEVSAAARSVSYLGHTFVVPAGWHLVDLAENPTRCVRFDAHAVYFGNPSADQQCAAQSAAAVQGAVLVAPSSKAWTAGAFDNPVEQRISATLPGVQITASYGADRSAVLALLSAAKVPAPTVVAVSTSTAAVSSRIAANLAPVQGTVTPSTVAAMTQAYTGLGFDACAAPSTTQMDAWGGSPFGAVGVYIGGAERACAQPNLTASWVTAETTAGWRLLPLYVGPQIAYGTVTDAAAQGKSSADDAATQASALGIGQGAILYYDMEGGGYTALQTATAQAFVSAWTTELHALHYQAALYGSETGAVGAMVSSWGEIGRAHV